MQARLLEDRVMVKIEEQKEVKKGGIIIPETAKEKPREGKVVLVGPGKAIEQDKIKPMGVKVGDVVLFTKYGGDEIKIDEQEYIVIKEEDIILIKQ